MRWMAQILILALLLAACTQIPVAPYEPPNRTSPVPDLRPDIPRTYEPAPETPEPIPEQPQNPPIIIDDTDIIPGIDLTIPISETIGDRYPIITVDQFPLLRHNVIAMEQGTYVEYEEEILFDFDANSTGKVIFGKDRRTQSIGTFLLFERDKPLFEYRLRLRNARFEDIQGRNIQVLGHTYVIAEANNRSVTLFGIDIPSNLHFGNESRLTVDGKSQLHTDVRVTPNTIAYRLYTRGAWDEDRSILLEPDESIAENVGQAKLASLLFDIRYEGTPDIAGTRILLNEKQDRYDLEYDSIDGPRTIPLVTQDAGILKLGKPEQRLHIKPCPAAQPYCIAPGDLILLATRDGRSAVLEYSDASEDPNELILRSKDNRYSYEYLGEPGKTAQTDIIIEDAAFRARIGSQDNASGEHNISVDLGWVGRAAELVLADDTRIRIKDIVRNQTLPLEIAIPSYRTSTHREERIFVNITYDGDWTIATDGNFTLVTDENDEDAFGQTPYGVGVLLDKKDDGTLALNEAREIELLIPSTQMAGIVRLEG